MLTTRQDSSATRTSSYRRSSNRCIARTATSETGADGATTIGPQSVSSCVPRRASTARPKPSRPVIAAVNRVRVTRPIRCSSSGSRTATLATCGERKISSSRATGSPASTTSTVCARSETVVAAAAR